MTNSLKPVLTEQQPSAMNLGSFADRMKAKTAAEAGEIQAMTQSELQTLQQLLTELSDHATTSTKNAIAVQSRDMQTFLSNQSGEIQKSLDSSTSLIVSRSKALKSTLEGAENKLVKSLETGAEQINTQSEKLVATLAMSNDKTTESVGKTTATVNNQQIHLRNEIKKQTKQLTLLMKVPILISVLAVLAVCLTALLVTWAYLPTELFTTKTQMMTMTTGKHLVIISPGWTTCRMEANGPAYPCKKLD